MHKALVAVLASTLLLAGCGADTGDAQQANGDSPPAVNSGTSADGNDSSESSGLETRQVGPLAIRFDPGRLAAVDAYIEVPPDWERSVTGLKLIAADRAQLMGREECEYGLSEMEMQCRPESEAGIAFAMLDEPFDEARERSGEGASAVQLAGVEGISWSIGVEGERTEFILLPAGDRTILVEQRTRIRENPDQAAIEQVRDSLRIES